MAGDLSQDNRVGTLQTPLGNDVLVLGRFNGGEGLGEIFEYHIEALSEQANIDFNQLLGRNLTVTINAVDQLKRYFNGVLVQARWIGARNDLFIYQLTLMPWLWLLSHTSDCRIFKSMSVPDIIAQVFQDSGYSDYRKELIASYPTLEYCVQYRESDMNFVCRLMEEYGIYYFFEHTEDKHTLVLADSKTSHKPIPGLAPVPYLPVTSAGPRRDRQQFGNWSTLRGFQSGRFVLNDYNYEKPRANMLADADQSSSYAHGSMEVFDYPGRYVDRGEGETLAKVRLQADQAKDQRRTASGDAPSLFPGGTMTLEDHFESSENIEYLVLRCTHSFTAQDYRSGGWGGDAYNGSYELASSDRPFRSPLATRKPFIRGLQSAKVVADTGNESEEIDVDSEGRVCVHFYWDRKNTISRRVRVAQFWAGSHRGAWFLPRIGDEVMVDYEEGDPDRPIIVGSVYNGVNTVPTDLPAKKTRSGILTKSSKNNSGYNMLLFDDTAGDEHIKLRAQKDLMFKALNNEQRDILANQTENVGKDLTQNVGGDKSVSVGGPSSGGDYTMTAQQKIVLKVGGSTLTIDPSGITLSAPTITIKADAETSVTAPVVSLTGHASVTISGAATQIGDAVTITGALTTPAISWGAASGSPPVPA